MYITLESDYAIRIIYFLAQENTRCDAKAIAEETGVTFRFALKILRKLVGGEVVRSFKGTKGGYELATPPEKISLKKIVELIEGPVVVSRCLNGEYPCTKEHIEPCRVQKVFSKISKVLAKEMEAVKISDLLD